MFSSRKQHVTISIFTQSFKKIYSTTTWSTKPKCKAKVKTRKPLRLRKMAAYIQFWISKNRWIDRLILKYFLLTVWQISCFFFPAINRQIVIFFPDQQPRNFFFHKRVKNFIIFLPFDWQKARFFSTTGLQILQ